MATNIQLPKGLPKKAHDLGINISRVATVALEEAVKKMEYTGARKPDLRQNDSDAPAAGTHVEAAK